MNEDFGVGRRRSVGNLTNTDRAASININKYRPASEINSTNHPQAIAVTIDDPQWKTASLASYADIEDTSGNSNPNSDSGQTNGNTPNGVNVDGSAPQPSKNPFKKLGTFVGNLNRKQWIIVALIVLLLCAAGVASYTLTRPDKSTNNSQFRHNKKAPPVVAKPTSPLTGLETSQEDTKRPVIGVMIENSTFARPQSGLKDAGIVYEAIAEYGITRFLALYQEANPGNIGPVRSARPYFVDWAHSYDAGYGHVGGSPDALTKIKTDGVRDLDQFFNSGSYHRISQRDAPHNVYTSMQSLRELTAKKGWTSSTFASWPRKKDTPAKAPTATTIDIAVSGPTYNVRYDYDAATNTYLRTMGGAPHTDADSGARLAPKVVIGLAAPYTLMADRYHSVYGTVGTGAAKIFQDGTYTEATWKREGNQTYAFTDAAGKPIALDPGQTWITVVGDPAAITYSAPAPPPTPTPAPAAAKP